MTPSSCRMLSSRIQRAVSLLSVTAPLVIAASCDKDKNRTLVPDQPSCASCAIRAEPLVRFGDIDGPAAIATVPGTVRVDQRGRYWINGGPLPQIFADDGRFIAIFSRKGSGPGELTGGGVPTPIGPDSVLVIDNPAGRAIVAGPDLKPGRVIETPKILRYGTVVEWPGLLFFNAHIQTREMIGWSMHTLSMTEASAAILRSAGHDGGNPRPLDTDKLMLRLASPQGGNVWTADAMKYRLTQWDRNLEALQTLERHPRWWSRPSVDLVGSRSKPPDPHVVALELDETGLLWIFAHVPGTDWRAGWPQSKPGAQETSVNEMRLDRLYRTVVDVIDPQAGTLVATTTIDRFTVNALPDRRLATYAVTNEGIPVVEVLKLHITGR